MFNPTHLQFYQDNGYVVVEALFSPEEVAHYRDHYMDLRRFPQQAWPGADQAQFSAEDIDKLRQLIQKGGPQESSHASNPWIIPTLEERSTGFVQGHNRVKHGVRPVHHRPELEQPEFSPVLHQPLLLVQDRSSARQPDRQCDEQNQWTECDK